MSAIELIIFGLIGYWVYWSVKHEGIFWIPRTATVLGSFVFYIWMTFKIVSQVKPSWLAFFVAMSGAGVLSIFTFKIFIAIQNKIDERVGLDPYNKKDKLTPEQEQMQVYKEALILDEIMEKDKKEDKKEDE